MCTLHCPLVSLSLSLSLCVCVFLSLSVSLSRSDCVSVSVSSGDDATGCRIAEMLHWAMQFIVRDRVAAMSAFVLECAIRDSGACSAEAHEAARGAPQGSWLKLAIAAETCDKTAKSLARCSLKTLHQHASNRFNEA
jgi:hypothetical protein